MEGAKNATKEEAKALFGKLKRYTETEQVQIALSVQAAEEWEQLWEDRDNFPNLRYVAVGDENTRESHRALSGIVKPISDPFWDTYYPPIAYRCRCTVRQESGKVAITQNLPKNLPKIDKGLGHNPGKSGKIFDLKHPYFENASSNLLESVQAYANYGKEYKRDYFDVQTGGYLVRHKKHTEQNWQKNKEAAIVLNKGLGAKIELLKKERPDLVSPDANYNSEKADFKHPKNPKRLRNFVKNAVKSARLQGEIAIIYLPKEYSYESLSDGLREYVRIRNIDNAQIKTIIVATEHNKFAVFNERDFEDGKWIIKTEELKK